MHQIILFFIGLVFLLLLVLVESLRRHTSKIYRTRITSYIYCGTLCNSSLQVET